MELQKIVNFLETISDDKDLPKFVTKNWVEVYDQSDGNYNVNKEIRIKTSMLRSDLCDFINAYIVVKVLLSRLSISLAQLKAGNNSEKLKNQIRQLFYSLYRSKKLTK